jgi:hypothetical protein
MTRSATIQYSMNTEARATPDATARLDIPTAMSFDDFRRAFEAAAPVFDAEGANQLIAPGGEWEDIQAAAERNAPNGLMVYARIDIGQLMAAAGHAIRCVEYLLGNHAVAERMFPHDPATALYVPLGAKATTQHGRTRPWPISIRSLSATSTSRPQTRARVPASPLGTRSS